MKLLLDTHVLVWAESLDQRLGPETRALLLDPAHTLLVSPVTTLELSRLIALSRLTLRKPLRDWFESAKQHLGFEDAPLTDQAAIDSYQLPARFTRIPPTVCSLPPQGNSTAHSSLPTTSFSRSLLSKPTMPGGKVIPAPPLW